MLVPEWAIGSDKTIQVFLPLKWAEYKDIEVWIVNNGNNKVEAQYSTDGAAPDPYITEGVSILLDEVDPEDGTLKDVVQIQIRRATSANFAEGVKRAEILEVVSDGDWQDNERHEIARQLFACYFKSKVV